MEIAFYVHHHGAGHFMRSLAIATGLKGCQVTFLGSGLHKYKSQIPDWIQVIELPIDTPTEADKDIPNPGLEGLHYAPLNISGQLKRVALITNFFASRKEILLVVDVSVEIAMLARLCGVATIVVRQHGERNDMPHRICYRNTVGLLAPYHERMAGPGPEWIEKKTFYTGGFSRFNLRKDSSNPDQRQVAVLIGSGGTSINQSFLKKLSVQCPSWTFHVIGDIDIKINPSNLHFHGRINDPSPLLNRCCIVIGNAGHNTVMECASLDKRFIAISEERPFNEQFHKAQIIEAMSLAVHIRASQIAEFDWEEILEKLLTTRPDWNGFMRSDAAQRAANYLINSHRKLFSAD
ncbi:glycosyltransferase [Pedobacter sp. AW1-32]|uniref:glycosyltransferase n=1 Tax=Pedobacter sp. AW1-32 TaxID=3383026 RepID=UPI003FEF615A